jgi:U4/U6.U5 tri-snRNP-associated protein 1
MSLIEMLESTAQGGEGDLGVRGAPGSRKTLAEQEVQRKAEEREANYMRALEKVEAKSRDLQVFGNLPAAAKGANANANANANTDANAKSNPNANPSSGPGARGAQSLPDTSLDDDELAASLARSRRLAAQSKSKFTLAADLAGELRAKRETDTAADVEMGNAAADEAAAGVKDGVLVFTDVTEFVRGIAPLAATVATPALSGKMAEVKREGGDDGSSAGGDGDEGDSDTEMGEVKGPEDGEVEDAVQGDVFVEPTVGGGMAATLALLRQQGQLSARPELVGRVNDKVGADRLFRAHNLDKDEGPRLEYLDKAGRPLTQKEAYRELSARFHGQASGKKKTEKKLKQLAIERKAASSAIPSSFQSLLAAQEKGAAHLVLTGSKEAKDQQWERSQKGAPPTHIVKKEQKK